MHNPRKWLPGIPKGFPLATTKPVVERLAYSPAEAAQALGISRAKCCELIADGTLPSLKLDRRRLIRPAAIEALLDHLQGPGADGAG